MPIPLWWLFKVFIFKVYLFFLNVTEWSIAFVTIHNLTNIKISTYIFYCYILLFFNIWLKNFNKHVLLFFSLVVDNHTPKRAKSSVSDSRKMYDWIDIYWDFEWGQKRKGNSNKEKGCMFTLCPRRFNLHLSALCSMPPSVPPKKD